MVGSTVNTIDVWWDGDADGVVNMGADECLAAEAQRRGGMLVRLYGWSKSTVSLGAFQKLSDALAIRAIRGMPIVRRPSGGGAIVHGSDLTYAAAVPKTHPWGSAPQLLYDALHGAMAEVLREDGIAATIYRAVIDSPSSQSEIENRGQSPEPFFVLRGGQPETWSGEPETWSGQRMPIRSRSWVVARGVWKVLFCSTVACSSVITLTSVNRLAAAKYASKAWPIYRDFQTIHSTAATSSGVGSSG